MNMTYIQYAWAVYFAGALGCTFAAWWMFLWAWRFVRYSAVVTVVTLLFTPYAIDPHTMTMAPAIYTLVFEGMGQGFNAIKPLLKVMLGIWLIGEIIVLVVVLLTRKTGHYREPEPAPGPDNRPRRVTKKSSTRHTKANYKSRSLKRELNDEEYEARNELLAGEIPIRAIRD